VISIRFSSFFNINNKPIVGLFLSILGIILKGIILTIIVPKKENKEKIIKQTIQQPKIINTPEFIIYIP
jgi:hypothetical protein